MLVDIFTAKDHELRAAMKDLEFQLLQATQSLAEYKHRAQTAEVSQFLCISCIPHAVILAGIGRMSNQRDENT